MLQERSGIDERERYFIVGRDKELEQFQNLLDRHDESVRTDILHIYGTGGVGKSTFLRLCRGKAYEAGACMIMLDSRDFAHTEKGIAGAMLRQLQEQLGGGQLPDEGPYDAREQCIEAIVRIAGERRVVLAFDTFEEMLDLEAWLRDRLFPYLPERTIVLLAGRHPLKGAWLLSPVWRERLLQLPMKHLVKEDCLVYLQRCGLYEEEWIEHAWRLTKGHPLTLSLAAAAQAYKEQSAFSAGADWFGEVAAIWLKEVPDQDLRRVVEAASVLRHFNQELLSFVMEKEVLPDVFDRLAELSFVRKSERGWQLHDLMRESTSVRLKERAPKHYKRLCERSAAYYAEAVLAAAGRRSAGWEVGELFRYAGVEVLRALTIENTHGSYYWETVSESSLADAVAYLDWRQNWTEGISGVGIDPETGAQFRIEYTPEEVRSGIANLDVELLFRLEPESLKLLRDNERRAVAIAAIIPFHTGTVPHLERDPFCGPYLASLTPEERHRLMVPRERPAGWFMRVMDYADVLDPEIRNEGVNLIYSYLCTGGVLVCSPFPSEISRTAYPGFGFCTVEGATHYNYDGVTATPTYVLDTRGDRLRHFLDSLFRKAGLDWQQAVTEQGASTFSQTARKAAVMEILTKREQEVAELVLAGFSNAETAGKLFVSEVTVKKHLKAIYAKLGINTRMQLAGKMMSE